ncbi:MAG TPA: hypothetical protein VF538_10430 [Pyrinomonadaceae bacterium]|jgi:hypothetical protein
MPRRPKKTYEYPDAQHTVRGTVKRAASVSPTPMGVDPPIIIQGGGSVTIYSQYPFELTNKPGDKHPYVYYSEDASIASMEMQGKGGNKKDDSDHGKFRIELYK